MESAPNQTLGRRKWPASGLGANQEGQALPGGYGQGIRGGNQPRSLDSQGFSSGVMITLKTVNGGPLDRLTRLPDHSSQAGVLGQGRNIGCPQEHLMRKWTSPNPFNGRKGQIRASHVH